MKESAQAALSYIKAKAPSLGLDLSVLNEHEMHIHIPQGAVPKDGPSAGIALVTAMMSSLLSKTLVLDTCMTGEITLHGIVLPIGGLREKVLAAQREGLKKVIIPERNRPAFNELPESVRSGLHFVFVNTYDEVLQSMLGLELPVQASKGLAKAEEPHLAS